MPIGSVPAFNLLTPEAPTSLLAMSTASASVNIPVMHNPGRVVFLRNDGGARAYAQFGGTASINTGYAIDPGVEVGPIAVPEGETQLSAILDTGTGNLRITYGIYR